MRATHSNDPLTASFQELERLRQLSTELPRLPQERIADRLEKLATSLEAWLADRDRLEGENQQLRSQLARYDRLLQQLPQAIGLWEQDNPADPTAFRLIAKNQTLEAVFSERLRDGIGKTLDELFPAAIEQGVADLLAEVLRSQTARDLGEYWEGDACDPAIVHHLMGFPLSDRCVAVMGENVTERKRMQRALQQSEATARVLLNAFTESAFLLDSQFQILAVNETGARRLGKRVEEMVGTYALDYFPPEMEQQRRSQLQQAISLGRALCFEDRREDRDFRNTLHPICDPWDRVTLIAVFSQDATESKQQQIELRQREEMFRGIFENAPIGIGLVDVSTDRFTKVNRAFCEMLGYSEAELCDRTCCDITHSQDWQESLQLIERLRQKQIACYQVEKRLIQKNGEVVWANVTISGIYDAWGNLRYLFGINEDISERQRSLEALRESEERFRQLAENIQEVFWIRDCKRDRLLYVSPAFERIWGITREEVCAYPASPLDWVHPEDRDRVMATVSTQHLQTEEFACEYRILRPDGEVRWIWDRFFPICDRSGLVYRVAGIAQDITDRKRAEESLRRSEAQFRTICEASPVGIFLHNPQGQCIYLNPQLERIYGLSKSEVFNGKFIELFDPNDRERLLVSWRNALQQQTSFTQVMRLYKPDGTIRWIEGKAVPVRDGDLLFGYVGTVEDITDRHNWQEQLQASLSEKEVMLREIHHRVKNNLQIVSSLLMLQSSGMGSADPRAMFEDCHHRIAAMAMIHEQLYRSENLAQIALGEYIQTLTQQLRRSYTDSHRIQIRIRASEVFVNLDRAIPFGLILNEVVANCLKHAFIREQSGEIAIACQHRENRIELEVRDNGIGLPPNFNPQTAPSLGLQLVFHLAGQLNGIVVLEGSSEGGTLFCLAFEIDS